MTALLQSEDIVWEAIDRLIALIPAKLAEVQARRIREPLTLPVPASVDIGQDDLALNREPSDFPTIRIVGADRSAVDTGARQRISQATHVLIIEWIVLADTPRHATLMSWRYGEAVLAAILTTGPLAGFDPIHNVPELDELKATPVALDRDSQQLSGYMAGASISVQVRGTYAI